MYQAENNRRRPKKGRIPEYTNLRCPMVGHQASWCRMLCEPIGDKGVCGRLAPHSMKSHYQLAIATYKAKQIA
jgi:hypothetical protein